MKKFKTGQLVKIVLRDLNVTEDGFCTATSGPNGGVALFEKICLDGYPSWNDFLGETIIVPDESHATIIGYVGRPIRISRDPRWFQYDVYEVLIAGKIKQVFKQNLKEINSK